MVSARFPLSSAECKNVLGRSILRTIASPIIQCPVPTTSLMEDILVEWKRIEHSGLKDTNTHNRINRIASFPLAWKSWQGDLLGA